MSDQSNTEKGPGYNPAERLKGHQIVRILEGQKEPKPEPPDKKRHQRLLEFAKARAGREFERGEGGSLFEEFGKLRDQVARLIDSDLGAKRIKNNSNTYDERVLAFYKGKSGKKFTMALLKGGSQDGTVIVQSEERIGGEEVVEAITVKDGYLKIAKGPKNGNSFVPTESLELTPETFEQARGLDLEQQIKIQGVRAVLEGYISHKS